MNEEIWKDIANYEGIYQVSNLGRVKRLARTYEVCLKKSGNYSTTTLKEMLLKPKVSKTGYNIVHLRNRDGGLESHPLVHRLVMLAFVENPLNKPAVNHKDGNKSNNCVDNLEWVTTSENALHAHRTGLTKSIIWKYVKTCEEAGRAKLKNADIPVIKELRKGGMTYKAIAEMYSVSTSAIRYIITGKNWSQLDKVNEQ